VVERRVNEYAGIIPRARLDTNSLVNETMLSKVPIGNGNRCVTPQSRSATYAKQNVRSLTIFTHESHQRPIRTPHDILNRRAVHLGNSLLLLDVVQNDRGGRAKDEAGSTTVKDLVRLDGRLDCLDDRVG
jgi:hypothetical protein